MSTCSVVFSHLPQHNATGLTDLQACQHAHAHCPSSPGLQFWIEGIDGLNEQEGDPDGFQFCYGDNGETVTIREVDS